MDKNQVEIFKNIDKATEHFHALIDALNVVSKLMIAPWLESLTREIETRDRMQGAMMRNKLKRLKTSELAIVFRVNEATIREWVHKGLPHERPGRHYLFQLDVVEAWLKDHQDMLAD